MGKERLTYKSDMFEFIHSSGHIKCPEYFNPSKFFDESVENTHKISPDPFIQMKARAEGAVAKGGMVVFPKQRSKSAQNKLYDIIRVALDDVVKELGSEYRDSTDPIDSFRMFNPPTSVFEAEFSNRTTGETFNGKSIVVQFGGLKDYTFDYLAERLFSTVADAVSGMENAVMSSILGYSMNSRMFFQYADSEASVFRRPFVARHEREMLEYTLDNSSLVD